MNDLQDVLQRQAENVVPHADLGDVLARAHHRHRRRTFERIGVGVLAVWLMIVGLLALRHDNALHQTQTLSSPPAPSTTGAGGAGSTAASTAAATTVPSTATSLPADPTLGTPDNPISAYALAGAPMTVGDGNRGLDRADSGAEDDAWTVVVRRTADGSLGQHGAVITYPVSKVLHGTTVHVGEVDAVLWHNTIVWPISDGYARIRGDLSTEELIAIAEQTTATNRPIVVHPPDGFTVVSEGPYRPPHEHELRYGATELGVADALGNGLVYTGVLTGGGFEDTLYQSGADLRGTYQVQGHTAVASGVNGGNGTLAWEPQPGVVAYVGYSGSILDSQSIAALQRLAETAVPLSQAQWDALGVRSNEQQNFRADDGTYIPPSNGFGCGTTPTQIRPVPTQWANTAGLPADLPFAISEQGRVLAMWFSAAPTQPDNKVQFFTSVPTDGLSISGTLDGHIATTSFPANPAGPSSWFDGTLNVDTAGCWRFDITFNGGTDTIYLTLE